MAFGVYRTSETLAGFVNALPGRVLANDVLSTQAAASQETSESTDVYIPMNEAFLEKAFLPMVLCGALLTWNCMLAFIAFAVTVSIVALIKAGIVTALDDANPKSAKTGELVDMAFKAVFENVCIRVESLAWLSFMAAAAVIVFAGTAAAFALLLSREAVSSGCIVHGQDGEIYVHRRTITNGVAAVLVAVFVAHAVIILSAWQKL